MGDLTIPQLRERVKDSLLRLVGDLEAPPDLQFLSFPHGTTRIVVSVGPIPINDVPSVHIGAITNLNLSPSVDLFELLLTVEAPLGGPRVMYNKDSTLNVTFGFTLPCVAGFQEDQFLIAVQLVADAADELDDYVQARFGGDLAHDPLNEDK